MFKNRSIKSLLLTLLFVSLILRLWQIDFPQEHVFDEVYYPYTAQQYLNGNVDAWNWWSKAEEGHAYAWVNPPLAQEIMAISMLITGSDNYWGYRLPGVLLGVLSIYLLYLIAIQLFKDQSIALLSAFLFSLDGLTFVQSRTGMLDIYLLTFLLASLLFFLRKNPLLSAIFLGMALATKWTALYIIPLYFVLLIKDRRPQDLIYYFLIVPLVYITTYIPFFLSGYSYQQFEELLRQEWWYHMHLQATHDYASPWWSWPLNLYPVWYYVKYFPNNVMSNIFASGNSVLYLLGSFSLILSSWQWIKKPNQSQFIIISCFALFWIPWAISPRIMFLYYFIPAVPFLALALGYQLGKIYQDNKPLVITLVSLSVLTFILSYPFLIGLPLPREAIELFFSTNLTKNPFGG